MTGELDGHALERARAVFRINPSADRALENAIAAYLAALPPPSGEARELVERLIKRVESPFERPALDASLMTEAAAALRTLSAGKAEAEALELLTLAESECWTIRCQSYTNGDDGDVGWEVVSYHMAEPRERVEAAAPTPLEALRLASLPVCEACDGTGIVVPEDGPDFGDICHLCGGKGRARQALPLSEEKTGG